MASVSHIWHQAISHPYSQTVEPTNPRKAINKLTNSDAQAPDKIQDEFEGSNRVKFVRLLTLKREFEFMKMKDNEFVRDYFGKLMDVMNQMQLPGEAFTNQKVVEKFMVSMPEKFEAKIYANVIEENNNEDESIQPKLNWEMMKLCKPKEKGQFQYQPRKCCTKALPKSSLEFLKLKIDHVGPSLVQEGSGHSAKGGKAKRNWAKMHHLEGRESQLSFSSPFEPSSDWTWAFCQQKSLRSTANKYQNDPTICKESLMEKDAK
ncbi:hypothetical protein CR513_03951, partial [Mucuna pruriens]